MNRWLGWGCLVVGLILAFLPLFADFFAVEVTDVEGGEFSDDEMKIGASSATSFVMMVVPGWLPALGGCLCAAGGFLIGRGRR